MKITQRIELEIQGTTFTLTKEEAESLCKALQGVLGVSNLQNDMWKKLREVGDKQNLTPYTPIPYPAHPVPWPETTPVWYGDMTRNTNTNANIND